MQFYEKSYNQVAINLHHPFLCVHQTRVFLLYRNAFQTTAGSVSYNKNNMFFLISEFFDFFIHSSKGNLD